MLLVHLKSGMSEIWKVLFFFFFSDVKHISNRKQMCVNKRDCELTQMGAKDSAPELSVS